MSNGVRFIRRGGRVVPIRQAQQSGPHAVVPKAAKAGVLTKTAAHLGFAVTTGLVGGAAGVAAAALASYALGRKGSMFKRIGAGAAGVMVGGLAEHIGHNALNHFGKAAAHGWKGLISKKSKFSFMRNA